MRGLVVWVGIATLGAASAGHGVHEVRQEANSPQRDIYIVAHQDDWQLFMGDLAGFRMASGTPAAFIYVTAGDDGRDSSYWQRREFAALQSTRVAIKAQGRDTLAICDNIAIDAHPIHRCRLGSTTSYFLRIPDGRRNGAGFARYGNQSLRKLRLKSIASIDAVDQTTTYAGWSDLVATIEAMIETRTRGSKPLLHTTDPSIAVNPHDHFDHRITGLLVEELRRKHAWAVQYYVGYALASRAANRSTAQAREKTAIFRAYDDEMMRGDPRWSAYVEHPRFYSECMVRTYARVIPRPGHR